MEIRKSMKSLLKERLIWRRIRKISDNVFSGPLDMPFAPLLEPDVRGTLQELHSLARLVFREYADAEDCNVPNSIKKYKKY